VLRRNLPQLFLAPFLIQKLKGPDFPAPWL
jgi:hypothetical protein